MTVAANRRCRTCPSILENYSGYGESGDQCVRCSERSKAVRAAVATLDPLPVLRVRKVGGCSTDGHHGCEHFQAILEPVRAWIADIEWCAVCGAETPQDVPAGAGVPHKPGCALAALATATAEPG